MEVFLDTNFIMSCIKKRIDFIDFFESQGLKMVVPKEVYLEMKDLSSSGRLNRADNDVLNLALEHVNDKRIKKKSIGGRNVDAGLIAKGKEGVIIATLDNEIKRNVPNKVIIRNSKNSLEIQKD